MAAQAHCCSPVCGECLGPVRSSLVASFRGANQCNASAGGRASQPAPMEEACKAGGSHGAAEQQSSRVDGVRRRMDAGSAES